jgi:hypothetical protein
MPPSTPSAKHRASSIRKSGDLVNDAVNLWSKAPRILDMAFLPENAFGMIGKEAALVEDYEESRAKTIITLNDGTLTLINNREAVYLTADRYEGAETDAGDRTKKIPPPARKPDLYDRPQDDFDSRYGWGREV